MRGWWSGRDAVVGEPNTVLGLGVARSGTAVAHECGRYRGWWAAMARLTDPLRHICRGHCLWFEARADSLTNLSRVPPSGTLPPSWRARAACFDSYNAPEDAPEPIKAVRPSGAGRGRGLRGRTRADTNIAP